MNSKSHGIRLFKVATDSDINLFPGAIINLLTRVIN